MGFFKEFLEGESDGSDGSNGKCEFRAGSGRGRQGRQGEVKGGKKIGQTRRSKGEVGAARDNGVRNLGVRIILL